MPAYKDAKGKWYCQFYYEDWTGQRKHKVKRGFSTKKEALNFERDFLGRTHNAPLTMDALFDATTEHIDRLVNMGTLKASTVYVEKLYIKDYFRPYFHNVLVENVRTADINKFFEHIATKDGKRKASSTLHNVKRALNRCFKYAMENYNLKENPVERMATITPLKTSTRAKFWTIEQYMEFYRCVPREDLRCVYNLMFFAGLRIGELLALRKSDVRINQRYFVVRHAKTVAGTNRIVPISHKVLPYFMYFMQSDTEYLLGDNIPYSRFLRHFQKLMRAIHTKHTPHECRHTFATMLDNTNANKIAVKRILGHATRDITDGVYTHKDLRQLKKAIDLL